MKSNRSFSDPRLPRRLALLAFLLVVIATANGSTPTAPAIKAVRGEEFPRVFTKSVTAAANT